MSRESFNCPEVLLLGNGLNLSAGAAKWSELLKKINTNSRYRIEEGNPDKIPYPLLAVLATDDHINNAVNEDETHEWFCGCNQEEIENIHEPLQSILDSGFDEILTTNYSYELERTADQTIAREGGNCKKMMRHTDAVKTADRKYMLHTFNETVCNGRINRIWHIHGEARKPDSIILGHYYYGMLLRKYQEELEKRGNRQYDRQCKGLPPIMDSWVDAFIMGDVYVMGFGFDFSEFDLWWLLNRKKREKASHGKVYYYEPSYGNETKHMLLESYGAEIRCLGYRQKTVDYLSFYRDAVADIRKQMEENRRRPDDVQICY